MLCGTTSYRKIHRFIRAHRERFNEWFERGWQRAPAHTSIRNILQGLAVDDVEAAFRQHSRQLATSANDASEGLYIAIDGKVLRGSFDRFQDHKAAQVLSAFCRQAHLILGHLPIATKSNEIPADQPLIQDLGLAGCVYTLDAMHCQTKTFDIAKAPGSEVIVQVKGNQPDLLAAVQPAQAIDVQINNYIFAEDISNLKSPHFAA